MMIESYVSTLSVIFGLLFLVSCQRGTHIERMQFLMGTHARIVVYDGSNNDVDKAFSVMKKLEDLMSDYDESSELSELNENAGKRSIEISKELKEVLQIALEVARETEGAFDPTIGALTIGHYGFGREDTKAPEPNDINEAKKLVDYNLLKLNGNKAYIEKKGMMIDLGGLGKGFAVDKAVELLKKRGIARGSVSIAGDLRVFGKDQDIYLKHPRGEGTIASFRSGGRDLAISTSGDYERFVKYEDTTIHHILIPKMGKSGTDFQSVTLVMEGNNTLADAYATALFALGRERAMEFLKTHPEIGAFIVFLNGEVFYNSKFKWLVSNFNLHS
ncbi:FAD:protein FMN transferase [Desulfobacterota bacterium AH_259_B03_O07]|nr:FAD:protein FMN transferase [Desulfobacterota bacterium AH_259_B03_O07]